MCSQLEHFINIPAGHEIDWVKVLHPTWHNTGHFGDVPQANLLAWYGTTKPNTTKHTFTNQKKYTTTQNKHKTTKVRFSSLLQHAAWKQKGSILVLVLHKSVTYVLKTLTHLLTVADPHGALVTRRRLTTADVCWTLFYDLVGDLSDQAVIPISYEGRGREVAHFPSITDPSSRHALSSTAASSAAIVLVTGGITCGYAGRRTLVLDAKRRKAWVIHLVSQ